MRQISLTALNRFSNRTFMPESTVFLGSFANIYGGIAYF